MNESTPTRKIEGGDKGITVVPALTKVTTLAERLLGERQRMFVGRASEIAVFRRLLHDQTHSLLFIRGQVGIGKSALLQEYQRVAFGAGHRAILLDARQLSGSSAAVRAASRRELRAALAQADALPGRARGVLLVDGFEQQDWLLSELVADLAPDTLLVCASRCELPSTIALDSAWSRLTLRRELDPLSHDEVSEFLEVRGIGGAAGQAIADLSSGFPLSLAIAVDVANHSPDGVFALDALQAVQHALARLLCPTAISPGQQLALDVCGLARTTTAELLDGVRALLPHESGSEAEDPFNWLAHQSFMEWTLTGLRPHQLTRFALQTRLRRERPRHHRALLQALRELCVSELEVSQTPATELADLFFLDRNEPTVRLWSPTLEDAPDRSLAPAQRDDHPQIVELIRRAEGSEAAALAQASLEQEDESFEVVRGDALTGLLGYRRLSRESGPAKLSNRDGASALVRRFMMQYPLQGDEESLLIRWFLDLQDYQSPSTRVLALHGRRTQLVLASKQLAYSFCVLRRPVAWIPLWKSVEMPWQEVGNFSLGEHDYSVIAFMWKRRSLRDVLLRSGRQAHSATPASAEQLSLDELRVKVSERVAHLARKIRLTPREVEILEQLCLGHSAEDIARNLSIRPRTVKFHQENLLRKTGAASRVELFRKLM